MSSQASSAGGGEAKARQKLIERLGMSMRVMSIVKSRERYMILALNRGRTSQASSDHIAVRKSVS
jgi:hypothetical protein